MNKFEITIGPVIETDLGSTLTKVLRIAPLIGVNPCTMKKKVHYYRKGRITKEDQQVMLRLRKSGKTHIEIASVIKCSDETVRRHLAMFGIDLKGETHIDKAAMNPAAQDRYL